MRIRADRAWLGGPDLTGDVMVEVRDGTIVGVEAPADSESGVRLRGILLPGTVSAHSHAFHRRLRGTTHDDGGDFWDWRAPMYRLAGELTPDTYEELATDVFREMLCAGITTVGEFHYVHHQPDGTPYDDPNEMGLALVRAARRTGIRMTLIDSAYLRSGIDGSPPLPSQLRFSDGTVGAWEDRVGSLAAAMEGSPVLRLGVAAHSVRAVSFDDMERIAAVASELSLPLHVHLSEQPEENEDCMRSNGVTPTELLDRAGFLSGRTTLVHATHTTEHDREVIAASGSTVCLCPTTEADLGDGIGPAAEYAATGVPLSLGSDANAIIDIFDEMRRVEHHDRLRLGRRGVHEPVDLLRAATVGGMRSLGWASGAVIAPGAPADLIVVDPDSLDLRGIDEDHLLAGITMAASRAAVTDVFVNGEHLFRDGSLATSG